MFYKLKMHSLKILLQDNSKVFLYVFTTVESKQLWVSNIYKDKMMVTSFALRGNRNKKSTENKIVSSIYAG